MGKLYLKYLLCLTMLCSGVEVMAQFPVHDDFEGTELSKLWDTDKFVKGAVTIQSKVVRQGHGAIAIVLNKGR